MSILVENQSNSDYHYDIDIENGSKAKLVVNNGRLTDLDSTGPPVKSSVRAEFSNINNNPTATQTLDSRITTTPSFCSEIDSEEEEEEEFYDCEETTLTTTSNYPQSSFPHNLPETSFSKTVLYCSQSSSDAFYSCDDRQSSNEIDETSWMMFSKEDHDNDDYNENETLFMGKKNFTLAKTEDASNEILFKRRMFFEPRCIDSNQTNCGITVGEKWCLNGIQPVPSKQPEDETKTSNSLSTDIPDVLVTLTSTQMGISAKKDSTPELETVASSSSSAQGDGLLATSIFDKAQLVEGALDTEELDRSMARKQQTTAAAAASTSINNLPSLHIQEKYSDEVRSMTHSPSTRSTVIHVCPELPSYGMEAVPRALTHRLIGAGLTRAQSAPMEIKTIMNEEPEEVMEADAEISEILGRYPGTPFSPIEERPETSLSEPFQTTVPTSFNRRKKRSTTWVKKKLCFVSYDTESDATSIARSDGTCSEFVKREISHGGYRSRTNSSFRRYHKGTVKGPRVSPVPRGGIRDFSKSDVMELNAKMRHDPQLTNIDMREWTSKVIGFPTPADYYAHMICDLAFQNINILALIKSILGDNHPLVSDIIEKLLTGTSDLPSFVLGREIVHRPEMRRHTKEIRLSRDSWCNRVETTLHTCGLKTTFFDKLPSTFKTEQDYFEYIARRIIMEGISLSSRVLNTLGEQLGDDHPFINVLRNGRIVESDNENKRIGPKLDSAKQIVKPSVKATSEFIEQTKASHLEHSLNSHRQASSSCLASKGREDSVEKEQKQTCSCFHGIRKFVSRKITKHLCFRYSTSSCHPNNNNSKNNKSL